LGYLRRSSSPALRKLSMAVSISSRSTSKYISYSSSTRLHRKSFTFSQLSTPNFAWVRSWAFWANALGESFSLRSQFAKPSFPNISLRRSSPLILVFGALRYALLS
jgi:hypothetical protein